MRTKQKKKHTQKLFFFPSASNAKPALQTSFHITALCFIFNVCLIVGVPIVGWDLRNLCVLKLSNHTNSNQMYLLKCQVNPNSIPHNFG